MSTLSIHLVCCDDTPECHSQIIPIEVDSAEIGASVIETIEQELEAGVERGLHNAAHHDEHGPVTYFQTVHSGGFFVTVGRPEDLKETFFGPGSLVAFCDDKGPGHGSKVGTDGVKRTLQVLKGYLGGS